MASRCRIMRASLLSLPLFLIREYTAEAMVNDTTRAFKRKAPIKTKILLGYRVALSLGEGGES